MTEQQAYEQMENMTLDEAVKRLKGELTGGILDDDNEVIFIDDLEMWMQAASVIGKALNNGYILCKEAKNE